MAKYRSKIYVSIHIRENTHSILSIFVIPKLAMYILFRNLGCEIKSIVQRNASVEKSFTFPIFHFVVSLDNWVDLTFIISGKCIAITVKELFANKSNLILNDIHLDILNWMSVWHKIFKVKQRKSRLRIAYLSMKLFC